MVLTFEISISRRLPSTLVYSVFNRHKLRQCRAKSFQGYSSNIISVITDRGSSRITRTWSRLLWMVEVYFVSSFCLLPSLALLARLIHSRLGGAMPRDIRTIVLRRSRVPGEQGNGFEEVMRRSWALGLFEQCMPGWISVHVRFI